ncbi:MAG: hypothetical protein QXS54_06370 [Candidatus Methanomethylicaceae archaeon]
MEDCATRCGVGRAGISIVKTCIPAAEAICCNSIVGTIGGPASSSNVPCFMSQRSAANRACKRAISSFVSR